jgi:hypothetical protein
MLQLSRKFLSTYMIWKGPHMNSLPLNFILKIKKESHFFLNVDKRVFLALALPDSLQFKQMRAKWSTKST